MTILTLASLDKYRKFCKKYDDASKNSQTESLSILITQSNNKSKLRPNPSRFLNCIESFFRNFLYNFFDWLKSNFGNEFFLLPEKTPEIGFEIINHLQSFLFRHLQL